MPLLKAPRAGQPIFLSGCRRHGAPTFFINGGSSPEHGRHPSSGIEWCSVPPRGLRPPPLSRPGRRAAGGRDRRPRVRGPAALAGGGAAGLRRRGSRSLMTSAGRGSGPCRGVLWAAAAAEDCRRRASASGEAGAAAPRRRSRDRRLLHRSRAQSLFVNFVARWRVAAQGRARSAGTKRGQSESVSRFCSFGRVAEGGRPGVT